MSALSQHLQEYLRLRRLLGHDLADAARLLPRFVDYLGANNAEYVTIEAAVAWSERFCHAVHSLREPVRVDATYRLNDEPVVALA